MDIDHIDHFVITTRDIEKCVHFYVDILGMELDRSNDRYAFKFGRQKINIHRYKGEFQPAARNIEFGSADFCLIADGNIEEIRAELAAKGATFEFPEIVERQGAMGPMDSVYLRDSDGNLVEISVYRPE